jgi:hypothetical protein
MRASEAWPFGLPSKMNTGDCKEEKADLPLLKETVPTLVYDILERMKSADDVRRLWRLVTAEASRRKLTKESSILPALSVWAGQDCAPSPRGRLYGWPVEGRPTTGLAVGKRVELPAHEQASRWVLCSVVVVGFDCR